MGKNRNNIALRLGYRLLLLVLSPALLLYTLWIASKNRDRRYLAQRLGFYWDGCASKAWWIHAASVGEVMAALPLLEELQRENGTHPILVTTVTPTGARAVLEHSPDGVEHAYLPLDFPAAVKRFIRRYRPHCGLIMETELWPNLYDASNRADVPLMVINGRVSARTLNAPRWLRGLYRNALQNTCAVFARSERDADGFIRLGAPPDRVEVIGNIKFAATSSAGAAAPIALPRPYVLAASTRDNEEKEVLGAWREAGTGERLLVIVPRHPRRSEQILAELRSLGAAVSVRSRGDAVTDETEVYLADTLGELQRFMAGAELVFMGGSLVPKGGHNLLEPARLGKAVLFGPHIENFQEEAGLLLDDNAVRQVASTGELAEALSRILSDPALARQMGRRAAGAVAVRTDMAARYCRAVRKLCR